MYRRSWRSLSLRSFWGRMAKHLSAVHREPHFICFPYACRESRRGTCRIIGWKIVLSRTLAFMFPIYVFWFTFCDNLKLLKGKRLKSESKLQAYPYCRVSFRYLSVYLCLAVLVDFQTTICQEVLIFTINILIYSFILSFLIFFLSLSY